MARYDVILSVLADCLQLASRMPATCADLEPPPPLFFSDFLKTFLKRTIFGLNSAIARRMYMWCLLIYLFVCSVLFLPFVFHFTVI